MSCWEAGPGTDCGPVGTAAVTELLPGAGRLLMIEGRSLTFVQTALKLRCTVVPSPPFPLTARRLFSLRAGVFVLLIFPNYRM